MNKRTPPFDFKGLTDWVPVFRAGPQVDSQGRSHTWTTADLDSIVANHDPDHPVPHVITHQELYSPFAYGRSAEVKREGDLLYVRSKDIAPEFEKLVQDGRLYERSVRILPASGGGYKLGHIAWLGAEPPAVEGLAPVEFSKGGEVMDFSLDWRSPRLMARMLRRMREFLIEKFSAEDADRVMPEWELSELDDAASEAEREALDDAPSFSKQNPQEDDTMPVSNEELERIQREAREAAQAEFAAQREQLQKELDQERATARRTEYQSSVNAAIDAGRLTPAQAEGAVDFMAAIDRGEAASFDFSVGEVKKSTTPSAWFRDFMAALPVQVDMGRHDDDAAGPLNTEDAGAIANAALEYQAAKAQQGITVRMSDAVAHVTKHAAKPGA